MNILVTGGGTKVPIDSVRSITNMSTGNFAARISRALMAEYTWSSFVYFGAKGGKFPFQYTKDLYNHDELCKTEIQALLRAYDTHKYYYKQFEYTDYDDYASRLYELVRKANIVVLAAAVSDYTVVNTVDGKIRSSNDMSIALTRATKLIGKVKQWNPKCKLVGFKLLVNSTDEELVDAARRSINKNRCDVVVANDLRDIKAGEHRLLIVTRNGVEEYKTDHKNKNYLANIVAKEVIKLL